MSKQRIETNQEIIEYSVCCECGRKLGLIIIENEGELAWEYARTHWGKDYSYTMIPGDDTFQREKRNVRELCDIIKWLRERLERDGGGE